VIEAGIGTGNFAGQTTGLIDPDEAFAQVLDASGAILDSSPGVTGAPLVPQSDLPEDAPIALNRTIPGLEAPVRLLVAREKSGLFVVVGATLSDRQEALDRLLAELAIGGPVALLLMSVAGWLLAGAALRPVERMRVEAAAISASEPERRLPVPAADDELARLARTLNEMLGRLQEALTRERRFVDDASHELRTPLGILKGELELALTRSRTAEELEAAIRRASSEADRLARLAEGLLVLARAEDGLLPVHREPVALATVVGDACDGRRALADARGVSIVVEADEASVHLDPVRLRQAVENLVDNAIRHSPRGSDVHVSAGREDGRAWVRVDDEGPGFTPEMLKIAFEPFAGGTADGAGLGLAIVRTVAGSHGGDAVAENAPGGGASVTITLRT
jgi:signal transduction histidine kinase